MKRLWIILVVVGSISAQEKPPVPKSIWNFGFLDSKTGLSLVGYSRLFKASEQQHFFIGGGTMLAAFTLSGGWTYYFSPTGFTTISIQSVASLGGDKVLPTISFGWEKQLKGRFYIKAGANTFLDSKDPLLYPFVSFDLRK